MKEKQNKQSAYLQIAELCHKCGIIASPSMTEAELRVVLKALCASLATSCPEQAASEYQHSGKENQK